MLQQTLPAVERGQPCIRVLQVVNSLRRGGVERQLLHILRHYDRRRFQMDVCYIGGEPGCLAGQVRELGSRLLACCKSANLFAFSNRLARCLAPYRYDVVHSHFTFWSGPILRGAFLAGIPVRLAHLRITSPIQRSSSLLARVAKYSLNGFSKKWAERYATKVISVSGAALESYWPEWRRERSRFLLHTAGVDVRRFYPSNNSGEESQAMFGQRHTIFCVASFEPVKNHSMLIEVFRRLVREMPEVVLVLIGDGRQRPAVEKCVARAGLGERVRFLGWRDDIHHLLRCAWLFLTCSKLEGLPNAVMEALACGVPVIASDIAPHREVLPSELQPYLFPLDDPAAACRQALQVLRDPQLRRTLGQAGRKHVLAHYDAEKAMEVLQELYADEVAGVA